MSQQQNVYTRWGIVASGEGGGRIASQFLTRSDNPGIENRILVMNTNRADIRNTIDRLESSIALDEHERNRRVVVFGSKEGVGNSFPGGEECAREDLDMIIDRIGEVAASDALLYVCTLGGGTGNGSVPYLIDQFKRGLDRESLPGWADNVIHSALGVWPYYDEPIQRQFNAVCGLSRLTHTDDGEQNADMVLLAANSHLSETDGYASGFDAVNEKIIQAIDLMISAGRQTRGGVIDVQDLVTVPSQIGAYHFTPGVAMGMNGQVLELEMMFDRAADSTYVPMDVSTCDAAYAIVRAPERMIDEGVTHAEVGGAFTSWKREQGIGTAPGMATLTPKNERGTDVDVLLLLGGFDLNPLLDHSFEQFEQFKESLTNGGQQISPERLDRIEENVRRYVKQSES